jgi:hypothetical protein
MKSFETEKGHLGKRQFSLILLEKKSLLKRGAGEVRNMSYKLQNSKWGVIFWFVYDTEEKERNI